MEYFIIRSDKMWSLSDEVNKSIKEGCKPQGGVAVLYDSRTDEVLYIQAMVFDNGI
jgi:hypothetical protein